MATQRPKYKLDNVFNIFPGVTLPSQLTAIDFVTTDRPQPNTIIQYLTSDRSSISWPVWSKLGEANERTSTVFTLQMRPDILRYSKYGHSDTQELFEEASDHIDVIKGSNLLPRRLKRGGDELLGQMAMAIFGSNRLAEIGCDFAETHRLCRIVFQGEGLSGVLPLTPEYFQRLEVQVRANGADHDTVLQRLEVVNHALAFLYIATAIIRDGLPFSEGLIKETQAILCSGISVAHSKHEYVHSSSYIGQYRTRHLTTPDFNFLRPFQIKRAMENLVSHLNDHMIEAEQTNTIDPFFLAARACADLARIHPFLDGNGRVCRLLLNTILLKYVGTACPVGENQRERDEYKGFELHQLENQSPTGQLATYTLNKCLKLLRKLRSHLVGC